jgi:hypothetical protein
MKTAVVLAIAVSTFVLAEARADESKMLGSCVTRTVNAPFNGTSWMVQHVCKENEVAVSGSGFCSDAGPMIGASTTNMKLDRDVWLWCSKNGNAVWYAMCCQNVTAPTPPPPKTLRACMTRTVNDNFSGSSWMFKQVCQPNEIAVSAGGFCSKAGQMVGASTTKDNPDGKVWLQCTQPGPAVWYGVCCQQ